MEVLLLVVFVGSLGFAVYQIAGLINPIGTSITLEEATAYNALHNPKILGMQGLSEQIAKDMFDPPVCPPEDAVMKRYVDSTNVHEADLNDKLFEHHKEFLNKAMEVPDFAKEEEQISKIRKLTPKQIKTIKKLVAKLNIRRSGVIPKRKKKSPIIKKPVRKTKRKK